MNVIFVVTGIGYGHSIRTYAIIKELLQKNTKTKVKIIGYGNSYMFFHKKFPTTRIRGSYVPDQSFRWSVSSIIKANLTLPLHWGYELIKLRKFIKEFKADLIVSDFEYLGILLARTTGTRYISIFNFSPEVYEKYIKEHEPSKSIKVQQKYVDVGYHLGRKSIIIIPTLLGPLRKTTKYKFVNPIVRKQPKEHPSEKQLMKLLGLKKKPILIILGGSNFGVDVVEKIVDILPLFEEQFIIFGYRTYTTRIKKNVTSYIFKPNLLEYLKVCKGVITLAGHNTLSECLVYKKPILSFPIKNQIEQLLNAYVLEKENLAMVKELEEDEISHEKLKKYIQDFIEEIPKLQRNLDRLNIQGTGAKDVVDIILKKHIF